MNLAAEKTGTKHEGLVAWASGHELAAFNGLRDMSPSGLATQFDHELKNYFGLAALSRSKSADSQLVSEAYSRVFQVRVDIERVIQETIIENVGRSPGLLARLLKGSLYGASKKQGVSLRLPLSTCVPTKLCGAACYAHDALDSTPAAVVRGAINGALAKLYEADAGCHMGLKEYLYMSTKRAVREAVADADRSSWERSARIRFSHVGEVVEFPKFTNTLGRWVFELSEGKVQSVIYSRHPKITKVDNKYFVVNLTIDSQSEDRRTWLKPGMRLVYSAFGGNTSADVEVNFLEHHRWVHFDQVGEGAVCPVTRVEAKERTCDSVQCDLCFNKPNTSDGM